MAWQGRVALSCLATVTEPAFPPSPLAIPDYRRFWIARCTSVVATSGMVVVLGYQLYDLARGHYGMSIRAAAFQLGLLGLVQFVPQILFAPVAGVLADRFDRRNVTALATLVDVLVALSLAVSTALGLLSLTLLFALAACHGTVRTFIGPAQSSIAPNIVPAVLMPRAVAISAMSWQIGSVGGPALAGVLFAINPALTYAAAAMLLLIAAISVARIRRVPPPPGNAHAHPLRQMHEGLFYVWRDRFLFGCVTLDLFAVLLGGATALLPVYARDILTWHGQPVGAYGLGLMRAMPSLGAAAVGLVIARRPIEHDVGARMLLAVATFGLATAGFGISRNVIVSLALLAVLGAADMVSVFIRSTLIQLHTPDAVRGRVSAITGLAVSASNELGEMESGLAAALLGATGAVVFGGLGAVAITAAWTLAFPELRRVRTFATSYANQSPNQNLRKGKF
jgi:MFS family permease